MKNFKINLALIGLVLIYAISACGPTKEATHEEVPKVVKVNYNWEENYYPVAAEDLANKVLTESWLNDFVSAKKRKPVIVVGKIRNNSGKIVDCEYLAKSVEKELLNTGEITFISSKEKREEVRDNRKDSMDFETPDAFKKYFKKAGADFLLSGAVTSGTDDGTGGFFFEVELNIINIDKNVNVWFGKTRIN